MPIITSFCGESYQHIYIMTDEDGRVLSWDSSEDANAYFVSLGVKRGAAAGEHLWPKSCWLTTKELEILLLGEANLFKVFHRDTVYHGLLVKHMEAIIIRLRGLATSHSIGV